MKSEGIAPAFLTSAVYGGEYTSRLFCFTPGKQPPVSIVLEAEWVPEPVWALERRENVLAPGGDRAPTPPSVNP